MLDADGNVLADKVNEHFVVELDDENLNRDLKAELLNMKAGEEKEIEISEEHDGHEHSEKFRVKVKKVERVTLPDLDDDFVAKATGGEAQTVDQARTVLRRRIGEAWETRYKTQLEEDLVNQILERNPFDVPRGVVDGILDQWVEELRHRQPGQKLPASFNEKEYRDARRSQAVQSARWMYLRESIVAQEHIEVSDADIEARAAADASKYGIAAERLIEFYKQNDAMRGPMLTEKIMAHLLAGAVIREADDDELTHTPLAPIDFHAPEADDPEAGAKHSDEDTTTNDESR
jgi:trigger factor